MSPKKKRTVGRGLKHFFELIPQAVEASRLSVITKEDKRARKPSEPAGGIEHDGTTFEIKQVHLTCPFDRFFSACCCPRWIFELHCSALASLVPPCRLSGRYHYCFRPSASAAASARFDPAAPAVGVSRRDKNCRKMTYSRVETQKHEGHTNATIDWVKIDDLIAVGLRRSKAGHVGRDTGQWCRR